MQATVTGKYFLEERFANFISAVFLGFQISQKKCIEVRHFFNLECLLLQHLSVLLHTDPHPK